MGFPLVWEQLLPNPEFFPRLPWEPEVITIPNCKLQQISDRVGQYVCKIQAQERGNQHQIKWQNNLKIVLRNKKNVMIPVLNIHKASTILMELSIIPTNINQDK
jgi:hypothetical protein